jgi:hypothetical protein
MWRTALQHLLRVYAGLPVESNPLPNSTVLGENMWLMEGVV